MALKFRRGTTAQQSGSLAFGEPFVNTTLQTLLVGGNNGDITLATIGTGSTGVFGDISGSGLDITGNARIAGNLVLGGNITIGDANTDTIALNADLSSSIIPDVTNTFDLGSTTKVYRNVYATSISGAIAATNGVVSGSSQIISILTPLNTFSGSQLTQNTALATITGSLILTASANRVDTTNLELFSASANTRFTTLATVTGSLLSSQTNLNTYTSSLNTAIQLTGSTVSFLGNIVVYGTQSIINSTNLEIADNILYLAPTASIDNDLGVVGHYNDGTYRHAGIFMDASDGHSWKVFNGLTTETSAQIDTAGNGFTLADFKAGAFSGTSYTSTIATGTAPLTVASTTLVSNLNADLWDGNHFAPLATWTASLETRLATLATLTGSNSTRLTNLETETANLETFSGSVLGRFTNLQSTTASLLIETANLETFSSSALTRLSALEVETSNLEAFTSSINTTIKTRLNAETVVSGSKTISGITLGSNLATLTIGTGLSGTSYNGSTGVTIANTGVTSITGTANQVVASASTGGVTLSLPQSINSTATPTFGNLTINGTITASGDITAYYTSDRRHKNNIQTIKSALLKVTKLNGVTWEWNDDVNEVTKSTPKTGLIAQEVQAVLPQVVTEREDGFLALDYSKMMGLMVEAIKEQQIQIDNLTAKVEELKRQRGL